MVLPNPNRPLLAIDVDFTQGPPSVTNSARKSIDCPARKISVEKLQIDRGRQYQLDLVEAGTATLDVLDPTQQLNVSNTNSAYLAGGGQIIPYRVLTIYGIWPLTGNLYNTNVSTTFDPSFESGTGGFTAGGGTTLASSTAQHFVGTHSLLVTQGGNTSAAWPTTAIPGVPSITVTVSVYAYLTGGCSLQVRCPDGTNSTVLSTQTTWTRITVTYTQVDSLDTITFAGTGVATPTYYLDAFQVEYATTASAFTTSGPTRYTLYRGYVERWPTDYDMGGYRATHTLEAVDALAILSRTIINQSYSATIEADGPQIYLPLNDTAGPGVFAIGSGLYSPALSPSVQNGSFTWGGDQLPDGTNALVVSQKNPNTPPSGAGTLASQVTEWNIVAGTWAVPTAGATIECWVRFTRGNITPLQIGVITDGKTVLPDQQYAAITSELNGRLTGVVRDTVSGTSQSLFNFASLADGFPDDQWHYIALTLLTNGTQVVVTFDGADAGGNVVGSALSKIWGANSIHFNAYTGIGDAASQFSIANWAYYPRDIGSSRFLHYQRGVGYLNEVSGARVTRLLNAYWQGPTLIAGGFAQLAPDFNYNTRSVLDVLQEIQVTENGLLYVNTSGTVVMEDRATRYSNQIPLWTFGDNAAAGELPYVYYKEDRDPTYVYTQANLSRPGNEKFAPVVNATTAALYGQRIVSQALQVNTDFDLTQAASFYLQRYGTARTRIAKLTIDPASNKNIWPALLSLEISQRITVKRRSAGVTTSADYYVEKISHNINSAEGTWTTDLQLSPVPVPVAWVMGDNTYGVMGVTTVPIY